MRRTLVALGRHVRQTAEPVEACLPLVRERSETTCAIAHEAIRRSRLPFSSVKAQEIIAKNIRALAEEREMSLDSLADFAGVSRRQLYSFLSGEKDATIGWLEKIADALGVELADLLGGR